MNDLASRGLTGFTDSAGRRWSLDAYAEMATRTAASRMHLSAQLSLMGQHGFDLVIVDTATREAPCPMCRPWIGQVLSLSGATGGISVITDASGMQRTAIIKGTVAEAVASGLLHPNCRHSLLPWTEGAGALYRSRPVGTPQDYKNEQKLRAHERAVRQNRAKVAAALTPQAKRKATTRLAASQADLRDHVETSASRRPTSPVPHVPESRRPAGEPTITSGPLAGFNARKFGGSKEAADYLASIKPHLTADQESALSYYTGDGFHSLNAALRSGDLSRDPEMIKLLDSAMSPLPDDLITSRRVDAKAFGLTDADIGKVAGLKGKQISDAAYMSTSPGGLYGGGLGGVTMHLAVPKGTPAIPASAFSRNPHETELLLGRGQKISVSRVEQNPKTYAWEMWGVVMP
jgi:hypothetical protein